ncbi:hypothetical protein L0Y59_03005 [Candidatus Uhrbacteria bacterium]|nr:hypothetical protein [Candidatus Uhrbacteria bacterium]
MTTERKATKRRKRSVKPSVDQQRIAFWEERFPGKGEAIMDVVRPFYGWRWEPKVALPDLEERAKAAFYMHDVHVRIFEDVEDIFEATWISTGTNLYYEFGTSLWSSFQELFFHPFWRVLKNELDIVDRHPATVAEILIDAVFLIVKDMPETAAKLKPLLDLWRAGNYPIGTDFEGNFLVLVAPTPSV